MRDARGTRKQGAPLRSGQDTTPPASEILSEANPDALLAEGLEGALLGITCYQPGRNELAVYSRKKCIRILMKRDGMNAEDANEYFDFNVTGAWMGEGTPIFLDD